MYDAASFSPILSILTVSRWKPCSYGILGKRVPPSPCKTNQNEVNGFIYDRDVVVFGCVSATHKISSYMIFY